ncbi:MAG: hypothetical protein HYW45_04265 [Candidatus Daviesbacteria bacterium]|nr:MAG: hypothetical protein HYW45_04265 [Candidatus Daviesbacteria bacterium]
MQLKTLTIAACLLLIALGIGYKFQERQHLRTLVDTYHSVLTDELTVIEEYNNSQEEAYKHLKTFLDQKPNTPIKDTLDNLDRIIRSGKLIENQDQEYQRKINEDRQKFQNLRKSAVLLIGPAKEFSTKLLDSIDAYYENEIESAKNNSIGLDFTLSLFETLKDYSIALNHSDTSAKLNAEKFAATFYEISTLEKYARSDFSFRNEAEIKRLLPYEYEVLTKYREYLKSYYTVSKDVVDGNYESAGYKAGKLSTDASNLTVDWSRIGTGDDNEQTKRSKAILEQLIVQLNTLNNFKQRGLGKYPFMNEIAFTKKDLLLCHIYSYKTGLYNLITSENPKAKTTEDLLKDLSTVSPKTNDLDNEFDKSSMKYTNTDEKMEFVCEDKPANKSYTFTTSK